MLSYKTNMNLCLVEYVLSVVIHILYAKLYIGNDMALVLCAGLLPLLVIVVIKHQVQNKDTVIRCFYICVILSGLFIGTKLRTSSMLLLVFMATGIVISLFIRTRIILEYVVVSVGVLLYIGIFQANIVHEYFSSALYFVYLFMYCGSGIALIFTVFGAARYKKNMEEKTNIITEMAYTDQLTGLYNRNCYNEDIENLNHTEHSDAILVMFDLNNLKICNDTKGHRAGDYYISDSASMIEEVFSAFGKCYRIGGDEFCVLLRRSSEERVKTLLDMFLEKLESYRTRSENREASVAYGHAVYCAETDRNLDDTRARADKMLYEIKEDMKQKNFT